MEMQGVIYRAELPQTSCEMQSYGFLGTESYIGVQRDKLTTLSSSAFS